MNLFIKSALIAIMIAGFMVFFTTGCTKTAPEIMAGLTIPAPHFDKDKVNLSSLVNPNAEGFCHELIKRIELKIASEGWKDLSEIDPSSQVTCSTNGKFKFNADFSTGYLGAARTALESGKRVKMQVRGFGDILVSDVGTLILQLGGDDRPASIPIALVSASVSSGNTYRLNGQVVFKNNPHMMIGNGGTGNLRVHGVMRVNTQ